MPGPGLQSHTLKQALRQAEERFRIAAQSAADVVYEWDALTGELVFFGSWPERLGLTPEDFPRTGAAWLDYIHPDDRAGVLKAFTATVETGCPFRLEYRLVAKDGTVYWIEDRGAILPSSRPPALKRVGAVRDLTAAKLAEAALRESEQRSRLAAECATDIIYEWDVLSGEVTFFGRWPEQLGFAPEDLPCTGQAWTAFIHPEDSGRVLQAYRTALETGCPFRQEYRVTGKEGKVFWIEDRGAILPSSRPPALKWVGAVRDLTAAKLAEAALRESEERFRTLFETMPQGVIYRDAAGTITLANLAAQEFCSLTQEQMRGARLFELDLHLTRRDGSRLPPHEFRSEIAWRTRKPVHNQIVGIRNSATGEIRWVVADAVPQFRPGEDRPFRAYALFHDITRPREMAARVRAQNEMLEAVLDHIPVMLVVLDSGNSVQTLNREFQRVLGWTREEAGSHGFLRKFCADAAARRKVLALIARAASEWTDFDVYTREGRVLKTTWACTRLSNGLVIAIGQDVTQRKRAEALLRDSRAGLRQLAARAEAIREAERTRIAREIHDELGQTLTGLKMDAESIMALSCHPCETHPEIKRRLVVMVDHLAGSIASVKQLSAELRPGVLDHLGLAAAIEWQAQEFQRRTGIPCRIFEMPGSVPIGPRESTGVFRIFQEILTNVARHAGATEVTVRLSAGDRGLRLEVSDNGKGGNRPRGNREPQLPRPPWNARTGPPPPRHNQIQRKTRQRNYRNPPPPPPSNTTPQPLTATPLTSSVCPKSAHSPPHTGSNPRSFAFASSPTPCAGKCSPF